MATIYDMKDIATSSPSEAEAVLSCSLPKSTEQQTGELVNSSDLDRTSPMQNSQEQEIPTAQESQKNPQRPPGNKLVRKKLTKNAPNNVRVTDPLAKKLSRHKKQISQSTNPDSEETAGPPRTKQLTETEIPLQTRVKPPKSEKKDLSQGSVSKKQFEKPAAPVEDDKNEAQKIIMQHVHFVVLSSSLPLPLVDLAAVSSIQLEMLKKLAGLYEIPFKNRSIKKFLAKTLGKNSRQRLMGLGASLTKTVPGVGWMVGGGAQMMIHGSTTWALGQVAVEWFGFGKKLEEIDSNLLKARLTHQTKLGKSFILNAYESKIRQSMGKKVMFGNDSKT